MTNSGVFEGLSIEEAIASAKEAYGDEAKTAVAWSALNARAEGRKDDYRLLFEVFIRLDDANDVIH